MREEFERKYEAEKNQAEDKIQSLLQEKQSYD